MSGHTLIVDDDPGIRLFGIVHSDKFYRTAWKLNKVLPFAIERSADLKLILEGEEAYFARYLAYDSDRETEMIFLKNRGTISYLLMEFRQFDFLFLERNYDHDFNKDLESMIRKAGIDHIFPLHYENLRPQSRVNLEI